MSREPTPLQLDPLTVKDAQILRDLLQGFLALGITEPAATLAMLRWPSYAGHATLADNLLKQLDQALDDNTEE